MDPPPTTFTIPRWNLINASTIVNRVADETIIALGVDSGNLKESFIETAILTAFFGFFTILAIVATRILAVKGLRQRSTVIMLLAIALMWSSTTAYWIFTLRVEFGRHKVMNNDIAMIAAWLQNISNCILNPVDDYVPFVDCDTTGGDWGAMQGSIPVQAQGCAGTIALTISVVVGDAIVWWRAWVFWKIEESCRFWA